MFEYYKPSTEGALQVKEFKTKMNAAAENVLKLIPEGREKALFKTHLETAVFFGTKSIISKDGNHESVIEYKPIKTTKSNKGSKK